MKHAADPLHDAAVDAAIARVLEAERAAKDSIAAAERDASAAVDAARGQARAIAERAERRIRVARERFEAQIAKDVAAIEREAEAIERSHSLTPSEQAQVARAVAAVAEQLTEGAT